jgi:hypothetical protein
VAKGEGNPQGMWRRQKLFGGTRLDKWTEYDSPFVLWDARILPDKVPTDLGEATKTELLVSALESPEYLEWVGTLASPIADMAGEATPDDFPAIVQVVRVPSSYRKGEGDVATSLELISPYTVPFEVAERLEMKGGGELPESIRQIKAPI